MKNERYIIVGASGLIGGEIYHNLAAAAKFTIGTAYTQTNSGYLLFDITKQTLLDLVPDLCGSDVIILMSAATDLNWVFLNAGLSRVINVDSAIKVIDCAFSRGAKIVFPSSENIFDGENFGYNEQDIPNPLTLYGKQKFEVENYITKSNGSYLITRFGWNIGLDLNPNSAIETLYSLLLKPGARIAFDNYFTVTSVTDSARALIGLIDLNATGIYHIASNPPASREILADMIIDASIHGHSMSYERIPFSSLDLTEPRPKSAWLHNNKLCSILDLDFLPLKNIVKMKVALLDRFDNATG